MQRQNKSHVQTRHWAPFCTRKQQRSATSALRPQVNPLVQHPMSAKTAVCSLVRDSLPSDFLVGKDQTIGQTQRTGGQLYWGVNKQGLVAFPPLLGGYTHTHMRSVVPSQDSQALLVASHTPVIPAVLSSPVKRQLL